MRWATCGEQTGARRRRAKRRRCSKSKTRRPAYHPPRIPTVVCGLLTRNVGRHCGCLAAGRQDARACLLSPSLILSSSWQCAGAHPDHLSAPQQGRFKARLVPARVFEFQAASGLMIPDLAHQLARAASLALSRRSAPVESIVCVRNLVENEREGGGLAPLMCVCVQRPELAGERASQRVSERARKVQS